MTLLLLTACGFGVGRAPNRAFVTSDLLIGTADMPAGWALSYGPGEAHRDPFSQDTAMVEFKADDHPGTRGVAQSVYQYATLHSSSVNYKEKSLLPGSTPGSWTYPGTRADEEVFVCYDYEGREPYPICWWVARYDEYIVYVRAWLITGHMTLQDVENILIAIDNRMVQYLGK